MRGICVLVSALVLSGCGPSEPPVAGNMTATEVCQAAGYLIRQRLGDRVKTAGVACSVESTGNGAVTIHSGYRTPIGSGVVGYDAKGVVVVDRLQLTFIRVGGELEYAPVSLFP